MIYRRATPPENRRSTLNEEVTRNVTQQGTGPPENHAGDGRVVVLSDDDLADLPLPASPRAIEVLAFVSADRIDPLLLHKPYYLGLCDPATSRPYTLLRDAMHESGLTAVARVAVRIWSGSVGCGRSPAARPSRH
ncbi:Ku protein [Streptomyces sioyaensis]|uniref:Ku protein n=1 Tax=Streptomyces sioyaensis TaxID=67364 RepID=UPI0037D9097F